MTTKTKAKPNILFIMADQWRFDWIGYAGASFVQTPVLDSLARQGKVFTHCCTNSPVCAPARISLATGLHPERAGCVDNSGFLQPEHQTYYQRLRDAGYRVGCVGKLDLAKSSKQQVGSEGRRPLSYQWGFTDPCETEGKINAGSRPDVFGPYSARLTQQGLQESLYRDYRDRGIAPGLRFDATSILPEDCFADVFIGQRSAQWIRQQTGEFPWHLFVSFVGPHDPYDPPQRYAEQNANANVPEPTTGDLSDRPAYIQQRDLKISAEQTRHARRQYVASMQAIDDQVGDIMAALEVSGQRENTYIVFSSDHGDMMGDLGMWTKQVPYDPSMRVPLFMCGPDIPAGTSTDALVSLFDVNPTICEWAGILPQQGIDAESVAACARGEVDDHREVCLGTLRNFRSIRTVNHLYVAHTNQDSELYNIHDDPHCAINRASTLTREERHHWHRLLNLAQVPAFAR